MFQAGLVKANRHRQNTVTSLSVQLETLHVVFTYGGNVCRVHLLNVLMQSGHLT